jgi:hypothetical protein
LRRLLGLNAGGLDQLAAELEPFPDGPGELSWWSCGNDKTDAGKLLADRVGV